MTKNLIAERYETDMHKLLIALLKTSGKSLDPMTIAVLFLAPFRRYFFDVEF